ncbi:T9SS type B sorting domain-containing protein [uncultured Algibacter sp.]|uniref:T9SS type B sorting domain-containing protein n=1 Tax=uncultured Algibacter sp. TaxID=298659 RepID=UPI0026246568|nr:T9SS type B sorting domain-containing protein [uncultured Algibacter sp.]
MYLSTPNNANVPYTIIPVGQPSTSYITGTVSNSNPVEINLDSGYGQLFVSPSQTSVVRNNSGYIIEAEAPIYVSIRMNAGNSGNQAGAVVSKGTSALGNNFRIGTFTNENPQNNYLSFISVMASEDNTQVTFDDLPADLVVEGYFGSFPFTINLNEGESYTIACNSSIQTPANRDGLIGSLVTSDKGIVVNCGSANGSFHNGNGRDYGIDQIAGLSKTGREYIFVKGGGDNEWENVLIVAHSDNTTININGNSVVATINAGDYHLIEGDQYNALGNMYVETSEDVFAYQGLGSISEARQGMFFVPPLSCETRGNIDNIPIIDFIGSTPYTENSGVSIVTKVGAIVTVNSSVTGAVNIGSPSIVDGNTDYETYRITGLRGNISVQGNDELYVAYFNVNGFATSGGFYSGFPSNPEINFDLQFATLGNCIPNVTLEAANAQNFDSFKWLFNDGSGFVDLMISSPLITPSQPGKYKLIGIISCTGEELESKEIPVSICPDDYDNDGIIDNLDIDNDNDGITSCRESRGDVNINLTNLNNPILEFQDTTTNSTITSGAYNTMGSAGGSNTFVGDNSGNFTSTVEAASNGEGSYTMTFIEPVNVKLTQHNPAFITPSVDGEYFIVRITPSNKNITLLDPSNTLLVDSNFDGIFETGITQISGSEIHFKINSAATATGTTQYSFYANQVDSFSFVHKLSNPNESSTFNGEFSLTCFKNDNDNDGIKDELDLDSDNDGIPDYIENGGVSFALTGIDADNNGLDDVYDINFIPIDSDSDGISDFYDLDSDNDGIYDSIEADPLFTNLSDTDVNGIDDGPDFGMNGWTNRAETFPDSNIIDFTIADTDGDNIFNYIDLDSDGDGCSDVIEAGFSDGNTDDRLGDSPVVVDTNGLVTNASDGYTLPHPDYLTQANITITSQPTELTVCENESTTISIVSPEAELYQWEVTTDGINWSLLSNDANYSGTTTADLTLSSVLRAFENFQYRVKLDRTGNSCGLYSEEIDLLIYNLPTVNTPSTYSQCDDDSNDGQAFFNLTLDWIKVEINSDHIAEGLTFSYFENQTEAEINGISISTPESYQDNLGFVTETIYVRVENSSGCARVVPLTLEVSPSSTALASYTPNSIYRCDDGIDNRDGVAMFNMTDISNHIENVIFNTIPITVHFYENESDAELETNEIPDIANHQNTSSPNTQSIWVRVKSSLGNDCLGLQEFPNLLITESLPVANTVTFDRQCDYDTSDSILSYPFDTSQLESNILNGQNPMNVSITYFDNTGNPLLYSDGTTVISPILPVFLTKNQTITVRVTNNITNDPDGACYDETMIDFIVDEQPVIANTIPPQAFCDDGMDITDENDGLHNFDLSLFESIIRGSQTDMDIYFTYVDENGTTVTDDASNFPNSLISSNQTISIEVINPINRSCVATTTIDLIVNPLPEFSLEEEIIVCGNPFVSGNIIPVQKTPSETFIYEWVFEDGSIAGNALVLPSSNITQPGDYTLTLTNPITLCSKSLAVNVKAADPPTITLNDLKINDLSENNSVTILNPSSLGNSSYMFSLVSDDGRLYFPYQETLVFNNIRAGFYTLFAQDIQKICDEVSLRISVIGHKKFFTPNGDGQNEYWQIQGLSQLQSSSQIHIYDRYGKLIKQLDPFSQGWDGTYNGGIMPTDDYWFRVLLGDGRTFMGHFTLKR